MSRPRTAEDKLMALLARSPSPMDLVDAAQALNWTSQWTGQVARALESQGRVGRVEIARDPGGNGRPAFGLVIVDPGPDQPHVERVAYLSPGTVVLTPSNVTARVIGMVGRRFAEIEYMTGPERGQRTQVFVGLLAPFQAGRAKPEPVRVATRRAA